MEGPQGRGGLRDDEVMVVWGEEVGAQGMPDAGRLVDWGDVRHGRSVAAWREDRGCWKLLLEGELRRAPSSAYR